jgi:hypothetical protein
MGSTGKSYSPFKIYTTRLRYFYTLLALIYPNPKAMRVLFTIALICVLFVGTNVYFAIQTMQATAVIDTADSTAVGFTPSATVRAEPLTPPVNVHVTSLARPYGLEHLFLKPPVESHRHENIQLYPIYASQDFIDYHKKLGPYLSLQKALLQNKILITEQNGSGSSSGLMAAEVNSLFIENISRDTIILLGGEVVRGGKQDRMIAKDFFLMPGSGQVNLDVFCVEHGRWDGQNSSFKTVLGMAPHTVREAMKVEAGQQEVWDEVEELDVSFSVSAPTNALADAVANEEMIDYLKPYLEKLQSIAWSGRVIGVVAVQGNQIIACDIFAQPALFNTYYRTLLQSYCSQAGEANSETPLAFDQVQQYFRSLFESEAALEQHILVNGTQLKNGRYRIHGAVY